MTSIAALEHHVQPGNPDSVLKALEAVLLQQRDFHRLFDARMIAIRRRMGLKITRPAALSDVPKELEA